MHGPGAESLSEPNPPLDRGRPSRLVALTRRPIRLGVLAEFVGRHPVGCILAFGVIARLSRYLADLAPTMDEGSLKANIIRRSPAELLANLSSTQLAPPGFLLAEWLMRRAIGSSDLALRLVPMLAGLASLLLFHEVARRILSSRGAKLGLLAFAASEDVIAYGAEIKQYSVDVAAGLAITLAAIASIDRPITKSRFLALAGGGMALVWFSHPAAFMLAGTGLVAWIDAIRRRAWGRAASIVAMASAWLASFAVVYVISLDQLGHRGDMWAFWEFAFPPIPPRSVDDLAWPLRRLLFIFVNPLNFGLMTVPRVAFVPALVAFVVGCGTRKLRSVRSGGLLLAPAVVLVVAASLRFYPAHGRLILFLVPNLLIPIAGGLDRILDRIGSPVLRWLVIGSVLLDPVASTAIQVVEPEQFLEFNPLGDRRPPRLAPQRFPL